MAENTINYGLNLHDNFTKVMEHAEKSAENLEKRLEKIHEVGKELFTTLGIGFAAFKGFEFIKEGMEEMKDLNIQVAIMNNQLKNSGKYSKEFVENLKNEREELSKLGFLNDVDVAKFQNNLIKAFSNANEAFREEFSKTAANIADGGDIEEAGRKLQQVLSLKPSNKGYKENIKKIFAEFGPTAYQENEEKIKRAGLKGHDYGAEMLEIIKNLPGVKGRRNAMNEADPEYKLNQGLDALRDNLGKMGLAIQERFLPGMEKVIDWINEMVTNHFETIKNIATSLIIGLKDLTIFLVGKGLLNGLKKFTEWIEKINGVKVLEQSATEKTTISIQGLGVAAAEAATAIQLMASKMGVSSLAAPAATGLVNSMGQPISSAASSLTTAEAAAAGGIAARAGGVVGNIVKGATVVGIAWMATDVVAHLLGQDKGAFGTKENGEPIEWWNIMEKNEYKKRLAKERRDREVLRNNPVESESINPNLHGPAFLEFMAGKGEKSLSDKILLKFGKFLHINSGLKSPDSGIRNKNNASELNVKGPKNTNIYVTINGGMGNFKIENTSTGGAFLEPNNRKLIKDEVEELLSQALGDSINQIEARTK
jgi:hypothetical protein